MPNSRQARLARARGLTKQTDHERQAQIDRLQRELGTKPAVKRNLVSEPIVDAETPLAELGIDTATLAALSVIGVTTVGEAWRISYTQLKKKLGRTAKQRKDFLNALPPRPPDMQE